MVHPATEYWLGFFETEHLHPALKPIVSQFKDLAFAVAQGPENQSTTEAVKTLVKAKDEACRAIVASGALNPREAADTTVTACPATLATKGGTRHLTCIVEGEHTTHRFSADA